ncbi:MAG: uroporphyrinogen-III synthase [Polaromonas sp.]|nr:uroporphyrinogen-III synthase [Polaromonas sp.]
MPRQADMPALRVIVTRPERDALHWVAQLQQSGFAAEALPLIEIAPASGDANQQALRQAWGALPDYAACLFVSGHAVENFFKGNPALVQGGGSGLSPELSALDLPPGLRCMAPGPGTVAALVAAGVPEAQIDAPALDATQFDSEALWQVVGQRDWTAKRVLVVRGQSPGGQGASSGRDWITRQWQAAGAQVDFVGVYQRQAPVFNQARLQRAQEASADGSVWLFSSSEALANLLGLPGLQDVDWGGASAIATHPRIEDAVRAAGWGVVIASRPALEDIRVSLASLKSSPP